MKKCITLSQSYFLFIIVISTNGCKGQGQTKPTTPEVKPMTIADDLGPIDKGRVLLCEGSYGKDVSDSNFTYPQISQYVRRIFQDSKGNLWFGSNVKGVARYDGKALYRFLVNEGMCGTQVTGIIEDTDGHVWFSTERGVSRYNGETFTNYMVENGLQDSSTWNIFQDSKGTIWVGTSTGAFRFNGEAFEPYVLPKIPTCTIRCIAEDSHGNLWFGTNGFGVCKFDGKSFSYLTKKQGLCDNDITCILEDRSGNMWFSSMFGGICKYRDETFTYFKSPDAISNNEVWTVYEDKAGAIWFSSEGYGVYRYRNGQLTNFGKKEGLNVPAVQSIFEDDEGRLWIGGGNGLYRRHGDVFVNITINGPWR